MKSKEEIVIKAKVYAESIGNEDGTSAYDYVMGYTQCQKDMQHLLNDLFSLWQSLAEVGEISVGQNFTKKYEELKTSLNKQD